MTRKTPIPRPCRRFACVVATLLLAGATEAGSQTTGAGPQNPDDAEIQVLPVQGNVYMLVGAGGNSAVQVGDDGVLVVDTQRPELAPAIMAAIRTLSDGPVQRIVNTHVHPDHTAGNGELARLGTTSASLNPPIIMSHSNVLFDMAQQDPAPPTDVWPENTYFRETHDLFLNGEPVIFYHVPEAHTDGDTMVFFRRSDVIAAGDIFTPDRYPVIDLETGGGVQGMIDGLNHIIRLAVPARYQEGGTYVIPGHGRLSDEADVVEYRNLLTIVRDRVQKLIDEGMSLAQVQAARPTLDYDTQYGHGVGPTAEMFVESVYRSLTAGGE